MLIVIQTGHLEDTIMNMNDAYQGSIKMAPHKDVEMEQCPAYGVLL